MNRTARPECDRLPAPPPPDGPGCVPHPDPSAKCCARRRHRKTTAWMQAASGGPLQVAPARERDRHAALRILIPPPAADCHQGRRNMWSPKAVVAGANRQDGEGLTIRMRELSTPHHFLLRSRSVRLWCYSIMSTCDKPFSRQRHGTLPAVSMAVLIPHWHAPAKSTALKSVATATPRRSG